MPEPVKPDINKIRAEQEAKSKEMRKKMLTGQITNLEASIARFQQNQQSIIDRMTKQLEEAKAKLAALG